MDAAPMASTAALPATWTAVFDATRRRSESVTSPNLPPRAEPAADRRALGGRARPVRARAAARVRAQVRAGPEGGLSRERHARLRPPGPLAGVRRRLQLLRRRQRPVAARLPLP